MNQNNQNKIPVFVHPGYPKTASTTLQKHFFPFLHGINYVGKRYGSSERWKYHVDNAVNGLINADRSKIVSEAEGVTAQLRAAWDGRPFLISEERITGSAITPRVDDAAGDRTDRAGAAAEAIRALFSDSTFDVTVIMTIREQAGILPSKYAQSFAQTYAHMREVNTFEKFISEILDNEHSFLRNGFNYLATIESFEKIFGREHIHIVPFELIQTDFSGALRVFAHIFSLDSDAFQSTLDERSVPYEKVKNTSGGAYRYKNVRMFHVLSRLKRRVAPNMTLGKKTIEHMSKHLRVPGSADPGVVKLTDEQTRRIRELFSSSNRELSNRYGLELERYGYFSE